MNNWFLYILKCNDETLYTGITTDLERRVLEHNESPQAAAYTRMRRPVSIIYSESHASRSEATKREYEIKQLTRKDKHKLIEAKLKSINA